ncbi:uncharacterized protein LOC135202749 [Macrobrachium nipponense]|uniref:uncharacterized protein LOC135202749 n=1 Tax=Macrobrachium nipponense TaxID=159736 RepID=UPI0030C898CA
MTRTSKDTRLFAPFTNDCGRICLVVVFLGFLTGTSAIRIMEMTVPPRVQAGELVTLACHFDLEGKTLYSLNWWRGSDQFYQFSPNSQEPKTVYYSPGITVDVDLSGREVVVLRNVSKDTAGQYKCEVLADYPSFEKDSEITDMEVIEVPKQPPSISVRRIHWTPNETLMANCTTQDVTPPPELQWYINGDKLPSNYSRMAVPESTNSYVTSEGNSSGDQTGLLFRMSQLKILLDPLHFGRGGQATLTCAATLPGIYKRRSKEVALTLPGFRAASPSQKLYGSANAHLGESSYLNMVVTFVLIKFL